MDRTQSDGDAVPTIDLGDQEGQVNDLLVRKVTPLEDVCTNRSGVLASVTLVKM